MANRPARRDAGPDSDGLEIRPVHRADGAELQVSGDLTLATAPHLAGELAVAESARPAQLVLDLRDVRFLDSTGLATLVAAHNRGRQDGRRLILVIAPGTVQRLLELTGLTRQIEIRLGSPTP